MKQRFFPKTLHWQLSLSYILVIAIAVPMWLGIGIAIVALTPRLSPAQQFVWLLKNHTAPQVVQELQRSSDPSSFEKWTLNLLNESEQRGWNVVGTSGIIVTDRQGKRLFPTDWQLLKPVITLYSAQSGQRIVHAALTNDSNMADLTETLTDGQTLAAVPLLDTQQQPIGVFFVAVRGLKESDSVPANPTFGFFWSLFTGGTQYNADTFTTVVRFSLLLLAITGLLGSAFGMVTARRITRRLQRITSVIHAWGDGQFHILAHDNSSDELGTLVSDLNQMAQQVQMLLVTQQRVALLEERQRMARDLHDSVKQQIFAMTLLIGAARKLLRPDQAKIQTYLHEAEELSNHVRQELTTIIHKLHPIELTNKRLSPVLRAYIQRWSRQTGIAVTCELQEEPIDLPSIEEAFFRITQEALANIAQHSHAQHVEILLVQHEEQWTLTIRDDGRGFDPLQAQGKGVGLSSMYERAQAYQGKSTIESTPAGTQIQISLPRQKERDVMELSQNEKGAGDE